MGHLQRDVFFWHLATCIRSANCNMHCMMATAIWYWIWNVSFRQSAEWYTRTLLWANSNQLLEHHFVDPDFWFWRCFPGKFLDFSSSFFLQANWQAVQVEKTVEIPQIEYVATQSNQMCEVLGFWDVILCVFPLRSGWGFWTNTVPLKAGKTGHTLIQRILEKLPQELKY